MANSNATEYVLAFMVLILLIYVLKLFHRSYIQNARVILRMSANLRKHIQKEQELTNKLNAIVSDTNNRIRKLGEDKNVRNKNTDHRRPS